MATNFSRVLRVLHDDSPLPALLGALGMMALMGVWATWFVKGSVVVWESSEVARIETSATVHPVQALVAGSVKSSRLQLGRRVDAGDVLVELDSAAQEAAESEAKAKLATLELELPMLYREVEASKAAFDSALKASNAMLGLSRARRKQSDALAEYAKEEWTRFQTLRDAGQLGELDLLRSKSEALTKRAATDANGFDVQRQDWDLQRQTKQQLGELLRRQREIVAQEGERNTLKATLARMAVEIARTRLVAPIGGVLGEVAPLEPGSVVTLGMRVGAIVPGGDLRIVAEFPATTAVGRLHAGQDARVRLTGFPWAEYGKLRAVVSQVATEPVAGNVRVELTLASDQGGSRVPLQHGLQGAVDVDVEHIAPARLLLRIAGTVFGPAREEPPPHPAVATAEPSAGAGAR